MTVFFEDSFDSAHWLPMVPVSHKCHNLHGHTYKIKIEVSGEMDAFSGWVVDYADIKTTWLSVKDILDHRCINDINGLDNSTCEILAAWIWGALAEDIPQLSRIELRETEHCGVVFEGNKWR